MYIHEFMYIRVYVYSVSGSQCLVSRHSRSVAGAVVQCYIMQLYDFARCHFPFQHF